MATLHPSRTLDSKDLRHLLLGLGFSAAGGGGGYRLGQALVDAIVRDIPQSRWRIHDVRAALDTDFAVTAGGIGAPSAVNPTTILSFIDDVQLAVEAYAEGEGVAVNALLPIEAGPVNAILSLYLGWKLGYKVFDCDGAGRAVPSLTNLVYGYNGYPIAPIWLAGKVGSRPKALLVSPPPANAAEAEGAIRSNLGPFGFAAGLTCWGQSGAALRGSKHLIPHTLSRLISLGAEAAATGFTKNSLLAFLRTRPDVVLVRSGILRGIEQHGGSGHDGGVLSIAGDDGVEYQIHYLNENMLLTRGPSRQEVVATAPSSISTMFQPRGSVTFQPLNHGDDLASQGVEGHPVIFCVIKDSGVLFQPEVADSFKAILKRKPFDYDGPFIPPQPDDPRTRGPWAA